MLFFCTEKNFLILKRNLRVGLKNVASETENWCWQIHQKSGFPLGFDPVADPDQVERDCWVQPSEFSYDQSFLFIHSFAFIIRTPEGFVDLPRGWDATVCPNLLVQMCEILHMVESVLQSFVLVLWLIQRDLLCSAADFYNTSSLKKSRTAHRVLCVHGSVCVCLHVSLSAVSCVFIWRRNSIMNSEPQGDMAASFWMTRIGRNSDRHAVIDLSFTLNDSLAFSVSVYKEWSCNNQLFYWIWLWYF